MLRKCTLFFDRSLEYLGDNTTPFENARELCAKLVELVQNISFLFDRNDHLATQRIIDELQKLGDGTMVSFPEDWCRKMIEAIMNTHRLEIIFRYPTVSDWDDELGYRVCLRRMHLHFRFFRKNEREPFHTEDFVFSRHDGELIGG